MENRVEMKVLMKLQVLKSLKTNEEKLQGREEDWALLECIVKATLITISIVGKKVHRSITSATRTITMLRCDFEGLCVAK